MDNANATATSMSPTSVATSQAPKRGVGALAIVALCAAACSLPAIGGVVAGSFFDKVVDWPWISFGIAIVVTVVVSMAMQRWRRLRAATDEATSRCTQTGC